MNNAEAFPETENNDVKKYYKSKALKYAIEYIKHAKISSDVIYIAKQYYEFING